MFNIIIFISECRDYANEVTNLNIFSSGDANETVIQEFPHMVS